MLKRLIISALLPACTLPIALAQMVTISAAHLSAGGQAAISNATISFSPVLPNGAPASYRIGNTGGQSTTTPISAQVTNGAFSTTIPDTTQTAPVNLCFAVSVVDNVTGAQMLGPGYSCVQPTSGTNSWCSGGACNFDDYPPNLTPMLTTSPGPVGATGPQGSQGPIGGSLSYPGVVGDLSLGLAIQGAIADSADGVNYATLGSAGLGFNRNPDTGAIYNPAVYAYQWVHYPAATAANLATANLNAASGAAASAAADALHLQVYPPSGGEQDAIIIEGSNPVWIPNLRVEQISIGNAILNGSGFQTAQAPACTITPGAVGNTCNGFVTWPVPVTGYYIGQCVLSQGTPDGAVMGPMGAASSTTLIYSLYALTPTATGAGAQVQCFESSY